MSRSERRKRSREIRKSTNWRSVNGEKSMISWCGKNGNGKKNESEKNRKKEKNGMIRGEKVGEKMRVQE